MPFKAGKPPRSPHDWLCRFCTTSPGNPHRNKGFRGECHRCHLTKGEAFKARSEKREPPATSTKESARVAALEKELEQFPTSDKEVLKAELDQAKAASDESVPLSKRIRAGQNQIAMHETSKRPTIVCRRPSKASWLPRRAWSSTEPRLKTSRRRYRSDGTTWDINTDKRQPKRPTEIRRRRWKSCSQTESPSTCSKRRRTALKGLQTSMRKSARPKRRSDQR